MGAQGLSQHSSDSPTSRRGSPTSRAPHHSFESSRSS
ncbi:hypothetical protein S40285_09640, partial [Stachybotrys chlorohalonatus IBT 40285]